MDESLLEQYKDEVIKELNETEFIRYLGLEFTEISEKFAIGRIPFAKKLTNYFGHIHGGILYALADTVAGTLACMGGRKVTTVDGHMNFLDPVENTEYVYCEAKRVRSGKHLMVVKVKIRDDRGRLLDDGSFTFYRLKLPVIDEDGT